MTNHSASSGQVYRVAIICRGRGSATARAYHAHPRTELVGLCDLVREPFDQLGNELRMPDRFKNLDHMICQTSPDIIAVTTATERHYDLSMRVLEYGVNIEVEKPICVNLLQADKIVDKAKEKEVRVAVHHQG